MHKGVARFEGEEDGTYYVLLTFNANGTMRMDQFTSNPLETNDSWNSVSTDFEEFDSYDFEDDDTEES